MKKLLILLFTVLFMESIAQDVPAQEEAQPVCTQNLRTARTLYDEGKLNEIPKILSACLERGFSTDEKVEAYRLLAITYLYLDEPVKADEAMLNLLRENPEYSFEAIDPAEYINLYKSFRTKWLFRAGIKLGGAYSMPYVTTFYGVSEPGEYNRGLGFQAGIFAEFDITDKIKIQPELFYTSRGYSYMNEAFRFGEGTGDENGPASGRAGFTRTLNYVELAIAGKYKLFNDKEYYLTLAPAVGYLLHAEQNDNEIEIVNSTEKVTAIDLKEIDLLHKINPQLFIGGGTEFKLNRFYLTLDLRYGYSFGKLIVEENRENLFELSGFNFTDSDHRLHTFTFTIGLMQAIYNPKKLVE